MCVVRLVHHQRSLASIFLNNFEEGLFVYHCSELALSLQCRSSFVYYWVYQSELTSLCCSNTSQLKTCFVSFLFILFMTQWWDRCVEIGLSYFIPPLGS